MLLCGAAKVWSIWKLTKADIRLIPLTGQPKDVLIDKAERQSKNVIQDVNDFMVWEKCWTINEIKAF